MNWEYLALSARYEDDANDDKLQGWLNERGKCGWELISLSSHIYIFKRRLLYDPVAQRIQDGP